MTKKKLRVVVIGTGNVAGIAIRTLQGRDDVELAGVWGRSKNIGMDAGLLDTDKPCGVIITDQEELAYDGYLMTAMRIVNAIPYVCAAPPGIATFRDLPLTTPSSAFRSDTTFVDHKICKANT